MTGLLSVHHFLAVLIVGSVGLLAPRGSVVGDKLAPHAGP